MGPGWANYFWLTSPGQAPVKRIDKLDGTYVATVGFTGSAPPPVAVHFENVLAVIDDSVTPDKLPDPLGTENLLVSDCCRLKGRVAVFLDAGGNLPHGTLGTAFNEGFSLNAGLEYVVTNHFSAEGILGYHHFPAKASSALDIYQVSGNGKIYLTANRPFRPFVNAGAGGYKFSPGSTHFRGNGGAGVLWEFSMKWSVQASYNFHAVDTPLSPTKFSTIQGGIRFSVLDRYLQDADDADSAYRTCHL